MSPHSSSFFQELASAGEEDIQRMGGKAGALARLLQKKMPVPLGAVLFRRPTEESDFFPLLEWWEAQGGFPVAVRSSASGEDGAEVSYAGQFVTVLDVKNSKDLRCAVGTCFDAVHRSSSQAYASHFRQSQIPMHVLVQRMIHSQFSGVYFSVDPRGEENSWLVEVVAGQGEQLVSGRVTPKRFSANSMEAHAGDSHPLPGWKKEYLDQVLHWGQEVEKAFGYQADIEWAIDREGRFWLLQSRPITAKASLSSRRKILEDEWQRLLRDSHADSTWDGHTFAEWTGIPTELSIDIWRRAFQKNAAFDEALKFLGYRGLEKNRDVDFSLLERVYGKAYLNLHSLEDVYFGKSPYRLVPQPRPHLEFCWSKLSPAVVLRAPAGILRMFKVAWKIQTERSEIAKLALGFATGERKKTNEDAYSIYRSTQNLDFEAQKTELKKMVELFSQQTLRGSFLITLLIESTLQGLLALVGKDLGATKSSMKAFEALQTLSGSDVQSVAAQMNQEFFAVQGDEKIWHGFLARYGHRGPGELDLSHPRWIETLCPRPSSWAQTPRRKLLEDPLKTLAAQISKLRRPVFEHEWSELKKLFVQREAIKMETMKPYAQIRWLAMEIAKKLGFEADEIFWLRLEEILRLQKNENLNESRELIRARKEKATLMKSMDLPMLFSLSELKSIFDAENSFPSQDGPLETGPRPVLQGVSLSAGLSHGQVHFVEDPEKENPEAWSEDIILVAEATDPGWSPLFAKARGVVVSRGGVLSHCAIVAREMGLPAVGEIRALSSVLKEGEYVWVDGNSGTVRRTR